MLQEVLKKHVSIFGCDGWRDASYTVGIPRINGQDERPKQGWPVLLLLQGSGNIKEADWSSRLSRKALENFVIISFFASNVTSSPVLVSEETSWGARATRFNEDAVMHVLEHALQELSKNEAIDYNRICITGFSLGGEAAWNIAARYGHLLAAVAPLACCGCDESVYSEQGAWNLSKLPMRVYQTKTERSHHKSNAQLAWVGKYTSWLKPRVEDKSVGGNSVTVTTYGEDSGHAVKELWEIQPWKQGEEIDVKSLKNHDVWSLVYEDESDYGLFAWLLDARNPRGCRMIRDRQFEIEFPLPLPEPCCGQASCPAQRMGLWHTEAAKEGPCVLGAFFEWRKAKPLHALELHTFRSGRCNDVPRVGDHLIEIGQTWKITRPFGLFTETLSDERCEERGCRKDSTIGWRTSRGIFYCSECWAKQDKEVKGQQAKLETRWLLQRSTVSLPTNSAALRCSCLQVLSTVFGSMYAALMQKSRPVKVAADLRGHTLSWRHDGLNENGTVELCEDGTCKSRWNSESSGYWRLWESSKGGASGIELKFGPRGMEILHRMRFSRDGRLVLMEPRREPASVAVPLLMTFSPAQERKLDEIKNHNLARALMELTWFSESFRGDVVQHTSLKHQLCTYLKDQDDHRGNFNDINRTLKLLTRSAAVTRRKLKAFPEFHVTCDKRRAFVELRAGKQMHPMALRKAIVRRILEFLLPATGWSHGNAPTIRRVQSFAALIPRSVLACLGDCFARSTRASSEAQAKLNGAKQTKEAKAACYAFFRFGGGLVHGHGETAGPCVGLTEGWLPASILELATCTPQHGLSVEIFDMSVKGKKFFSDCLDKGQLRLLKQMVWPSEAVAEKHWPVLDHWQLALRLEGILNVDDDSEFSLRIGFPEDAVGNLFIDGLAYQREFRKEVKWSASAGQQHIRIDLLYLPNDLFKHGSPLQLLHRSHGEEWKAVRPDLWTLPTAWPVVVPADTNHWHCRSGRSVATPVPLRMPPAFIQDSDSLPRDPKLSLLLLRWGDEERRQSTGAGEMSPTDAFIEEFCKAHVLRHLGPRYQILTAFVKSSDELRQVSEDWAAVALQGQQKAALIFLWPSRCLDPQPSGFVSEGPLFDLMARLERAGVPCRYPHSPHVYQALVAKAWTADLSAMPGNKVPPTCRLSASAVAIDAVAAAACAARALSQIQSGSEEQCSTLGQDFIVKLGFSWNAADVRAAGNEKELAVVLKDMLSKGGMHCQHGEVLVQRRVHGIICEPSVFLVDGCIHETRYGTEVLGHRSFSHMSEVDALKQIFQGDVSQLAEVTTEIRRLATLLLRWLLTLGAEVPGFLRLDFLVARSPTSSPAEEGRLETWVGEVCEMGGGLCGLSGGRTVPFQNLLRHCLAPKPTATAALSGASAVERQDKSRGFSEPKVWSNHGLEQTAVAGTAIFCFFCLEYLAGHEVVATGGGLHCRIGLSEGWLRGIIDQDFQGSKFLETDTSTWVHVRLERQGWADSHGRIVEPPMTRIHPRHIRTTPPPEPEVSFIVVRQGGDGASKVPKDSWFSKASVSQILDAIRKRFSTRYEVFTAFVETAADLDAVSASWASVALKGKLRLGAYFLCPSLDRLPLVAGYAQQECLLPLMGRMERAGVQTWFPNKACQYATLTQKSWSAHLSAISDMRLPATTRVSPALAANDPLRAARVACDALAAIRHASGGRCTGKGVVKLAPSWEGRGVWLFSSESELAELLKRACDGRQDHVLVQDFVPDVVVEVRLHVVHGKVAKTTYTRCEASATSPVRSSFGGRDAEGRWAAKNYIETESPDEVAEQCFPGSHGDLGLAVAKCNALVGKWWPFLLADCAEPPSYIRFDFLLALGPTGPEVWTGELTELGGQMCGWSNGRSEVISALLDEIETLANPSSS